MVWQKCGKSVAKKACSVTFATDMYMLVNKIIMNIVLQNVAKNSEKKLFFIREKIVVKVLTRSRK